MLGVAQGKKGAGLLVPAPHLKTVPSLTAAECSHLGRELFVAGGNIVDAGVGAALCLAVVHPHATGLGQ